MPTENTIKFTENPVATAEPDRYVAIQIDMAAALKSWRKSLFSFEWLHADGRIKELSELSEAEQSKRQEAERLLKTGGPILMPVLGIGIMDNIEIGCGRAELLTLAAHGVKTIPVHIPKSCESDFKAFRAGVK